MVKQELMMDPEELGDVIGEIPDTVKTTLIEQLIDENIKDRFRSQINARISEATEEKKNQEKSQKQAADFYTAIDALYDQQQEYTGAEISTRIYDLTDNVKILELEDQLQIQANTLFREKMKKYVAVALGDKAKSDAALKSAERITQSIQVMKLWQKEIKEKK